MNLVTSVVWTGRHFKYTAMCYPLQPVSILEKEFALCILSSKQRLTVLSETHHVCFWHWTTTLLFIHFCSHLIVGAGLSHCCILSGGDRKAWWSSTKAVQQRSFDLQICIISLGAFSTSQVYFYVTWWPCYCAFYHIQKGKEYVPIYWAGSAGHGDNANLFNGHGANVQWSTSFKLQSSLACLKNPKLNRRLNGSGATVNSNISNMYAMNQALAM